MTTHGPSHEHLHPGDTIAHVDCLCGACGWPMVRGRVLTHLTNGDKECGRPVWELHPVFPECRAMDEAEHGPPEADGSWYWCVTFGQPRRFHVPIPLAEVFELRPDEKPALRVVS